jgi:hypothetical protein
MHEVGKKRNEGIKKNKRLNAAERQRKPNIKTKAHYK